MIKNVTITNHKNESLVLELRNPEKSGFLIQEISGLTPVKADVATVELATGDGAVFNSTRLVSRNIVFQLRLLDKPTIEATRIRSYNYFPLKKKIRIAVETDSRLCEIHGYVESNDIVIFSESQVAVISVICPDPYFYSLEDGGKTVTIFSGVEPLFEFPFANESVSNPLLTFGELLTNQVMNVLYLGEGSVGLDIFITATGVAENISIFNLRTYERMTIDTVRLTTLIGTGIVAGDIIHISTIRGEKAITLLREGLRYNIIACLDRDSSWFRLESGDNLFVFSADSGIINLHYRIENKTVYEGV